MITKKGVVIKKSGDKTIKVQVHDFQNHDKYKKQFRKTKNFLVHDEENKAKVDDVVNIQQSVPTSKKKSWTLTSIQN